MQLPPASVVAAKQLPLRSPCALGGGGCTAWARAWLRLLPASKERQLRARRAGGAATLPSSHTAHHSTAAVQRSTPRRVLRHVCSQAALKLSPPWCPSPGSSHTPQGTQPVHRQGVGCRLEAGCKVQGCVQRVQRSGHNRVQIAGVCAACAEVKALQSAECRGMCSVCRGRGTTEGAGKAVAGDRKLGSRRWCSNPFAGMHEGAQAWRQSRVLWACASSLGTQDQLACWAVHVLWLLCASRTGFMRSSAYLRRGGHPP